MPVFEKYKRRNESAFLCQTEGDRIGYWEVRLVCIVLQKYQTGVIALKERLRMTSGGFKPFIFGTIESLASILITDFPLTDTD